jgi:hypothetical protein
VEVIDEGDGRPPLTQAPQLLCHRTEQAKAVERLDRRIWFGGHVLLAAQLDDEI